MRTKKHPNTPSQEMQEKEMKTLTLRSKRLLRFTGTHCPRKYKKILANKGRHDIYQKFIER